MEGANRLGTSTRNRYVHVHVYAVQWNHSDSLGTELVNEVSSFRNKNMYVYIPAFNIYTMYMYVHVTLGKGGVGLSTLLGFSVDSGAH